MRMLVVGGPRDRASSDVVQWRGLQLQPTRSQFDLLVRYNWHTPQMLPQVRRPRVEAFAEAVRTYDAILCETPEALILAGEWQRRGLSPRPVVALEVEGLLRVEAMRRWYAHVGETDPWPTLQSAPWITFLSASTTQRNRLQEAGVAAERIFDEFGCTALFSMFNPALEVQLAGDDAADAPLAEGLPFGGVLLPGGGRRDHVTALKAVGLQPSLPFCIVDELLHRKRHQLEQVDPDGLDNLQWLAPLPLPRFVALVRRARVLVVTLQPGLGDGGHTTIATAHRLGVPVVVSDVPGVRDYVTDGVDARLVTPSDPQALAQAVAEVWDDREGNRARVAAGRAREAERCRVSGDGLRAALALAADGVG